MLPVTEGIVQKIVKYLEEQRICIEFDIVNSYKIEGDAVKGKQRGGFSYYRCKWLPAGILDPDLLIVFDKLQLITDCAEDHLLFDHIGKDIPVIGMVSDQLNVPG